MEQMQMIIVSDDSESGGQSASPAGGARVEPSGGQVLFLGSPLRIRAAFSRRETSTGNKEPYHFLIVTAGDHEVVIRSSPHGHNVKVFLDGREMREG